MYLTKVDAEGVPRLVQSVRWNGGLLLFHTMLFDGSLFDVPMEYVEARIGTLRQPPTATQLEAAFVVITALVQSIAKS